MSDIFEVIETALKKAGYRIMDDGENSIVVRHDNSDYAYRIRVTDEET